MRILTAGESHGPCLTAIIEGFPAGLTIDIAQINNKLTKRQQGYGRGKRMQIEQDKITFLSGVRNCVTLGSPITIQIQNKDWANWQKVMGIETIDELASKKRQVVKPRPGHADLVGGQKRRFKDLRNVLERSSARETAIIVAIGALCEQLLNYLDVQTYSYVIQIGSVISEANLDVQTFNQQVTNSKVRMLSDKASRAAYDLIDQAKQEGTSLGGKFAVEVHNLPPGIGDYTQWDQKLDGKLAQAVMSINAVKSVTIGDGEALATLPGAEVMDGIKYENQQYLRTANFLGGIEGGMTNGMPLKVSGIMKPIPTQYKPLPTVNIATKEKTFASVERSDTCAVPASSIVAEAVVTRVIADVILEQFDAVEITRLLEQWQAYREEISNY